MLSQRPRGVKSAQLNHLKLKKRLPEPSPDQHAFQDAFRFKLIRIAHGEKQFVLRLKAAANDY